MTEVQEWEFLEMIRSCQEFHNLILNNVNRELKLKSLETTREVLLSISKTLTSLHMDPERQRKFISFVYAYNFLEIIEINVKQHACVS